MGPSLCIGQMSVPHLNSFVVLVTGYVIGLITRILLKLKLLISFEFQKRFKVLNNEVGMFFLFHKYFESMHLHCVSYLEIYFFMLKI